MLSCLNQTSDSFRRFNQNLVVQKPHPVGLFHLEQWRHQTVGPAFLFVSRDYLPARGAPNWGSDPSFRERCRVCFWGEFLATSWGVCVPPTTKKTYNRTSGKRHKNFKDDLSWMFAIFATRLLVKFHECSVDMTLA